MKKIINVITTALKAIIAYVFAFYIPLSTFLFPHFSVDVKLGIDLILYTAVLEFIILLIDNFVTDIYIKRKNKTKIILLTGNSAETAEYVVSSSGYKIKNTNVKLIFPEWVDITHPHYPELKHTKNKNEFKIRVTDFGSRSYKFNLQVSYMYKNGDKNTPIKQSIDGNWLAKLLFYRKSDEQIIIDYVEKE